MKSALFIALFATAFLYSSALITQTTPDFFNAQWWFVMTDPGDCADHQVCCPQNMITLAPKDDTNQSLILTATSWIGEACKVLQIDENYKMEIPVKSDSSFNSWKDPVTNDKDIVFEPSNIHFHHNFSSNNTQRVLFDLGIDYTTALQGGEAVHVSLSRQNKSGSILTAFGVGLVGLVALLF